MKGPAALVVLFLALAGAAFLVLRGGGEPALAPGGGPGGEAAADAPAPEQGTAPRRKAAEGGGETESRPVRVVEVAVFGEGTGPVAGARVLFRPDPPAGEGAIEARTGAGGVARLELPHSRDGVLRVDHPDHLPWHAALSGGKAYIEVRLERAAVLAGRVLGPEGRPLAGALVRLEGGSARTGPAGRYRVSRLPPGPGRLVTCRSMIEGVVDQRRRVDLRAGEESRVDFDFTATGPVVEGYLLDRFEQPRPGWGLVVHELEGEDRAQVEVDGEGHFRLRWPRPGRLFFLALRTREPGRNALLYLGARQVPATGLGGVRFHLGPVEIGGRLAAPAGEEPPPRAEIEVYREKGVDLDLAGSIRLAAGEREFLLPALPAGTYRLVAQAPGYPEKMVWLGDLAPGRTDAGTIELSRRGSGELVIRTEGKGCDPPRSFDLWRQEGDSLIPLTSRPAAAGKEGERLYPGIPAGRWGLRVEAPGFVPGEMSVEIEPGRRSRLTLVFVRGHPLTLRVEVPPGAPEPQALYGRIGAEGPVHEAKPRGGGLWTFTALPPGRHRLTLAAPGYRPTRLPVTLPAGDAQPPKAALTPR